jgi:dephospho-CoA kinase
VVKEFGPGILAEDGSIDRRRLGQVVFSQGERRAALNRIVHPPVRDAWRAWAADRQADGEHAVVVIPLLYEVGEGQGWDAVVCVACSPDEQRRRLRGRGLTPGEVDQRLEAQMPLARKTALSDYVIYNSGSLKVLEEQTVRVWRRVLERQTW